MATETPRNKTSPRGRKPAQKPAAVPPAPSTSQDQRFRLLVDGITDYAIIMVDPQGLVASWNAGAERIKGYRKEEILGQPFARFYTPEDQQAGKPELELRTALTEGRFEDIGWRVRKDG